MLALIGLENEGGRGKFARHAVGARFLDYLARQFGCEWSNHSGVRMTEMNGIRFIVQTEGKLHYCGDVIVPHLVNYAFHQICVVYDETGMSMGEMECVAGALGLSDNGHLGLRNMMSALGTAAFPRIAVGIGERPPKDQWEEFFNGELPVDVQNLYRDSFAEFVAQSGFVGDLEDEDAMREVNANIVLSAQLHQREVNLPMHTSAVKVSRRDAEYLENAVQRLLRIVSQISGKYSRACHEGVQNRELVDLLECGIPKEMIPLVRSNRAHWQHLSFDFQSGKLVEINSAPMPAFVATRARELLGLDGPGDTLSVEMFLEAVVNRSRRSVRGGGSDMVLILDRIGELNIGKTGWTQYVLNWLQGQEIDVALGAIQEYPEPGVILANLTWMHPSRWDSVLTRSVWEGRTHVFPSPRNFLFTSKWFMHLLTDEYARDIFELSIKDRAFLDEVIPLTLDGNRELATVRYLIRHGHKLYAKPHLMSGGRGGGVIRKNRDLRDIELPFVVQEWLEPYKTPEGDNYDIRIMTYGDSGQDQVWQARVWSGGSSTLMRPLDAPVVYE